MIKELSELGKVVSKRKYGKWNHIALKDETVSIDLVIGKNGSFYKFEPFEKITTIAEAITAKKGKARLLLDKAEEVLRYGGDSSKKKHQWFLEKLNQYQGSNELKPVLNFYQKNKKNGFNKAMVAFKKEVPEKIQKGNLAFRIKGSDVRIHEEPNVLRAVMKKYEIEVKGLLAKSKKCCSVCGKSDFPVEDIPHGMIKRVPAGQTSGSALVSYNEKAFESYELKGNDNSAICTNCARTYVEGLNWLLSSGHEVVVETKKGKEKKRFRYTNRKNFGSDTAMVFWTRQNKQIPEIDQLENPNPDDVGCLIESVGAGREKDSRYFEPDWFYSCTLSGAAARIAVRDWIETSLFDFRKAIAKWFQDIVIGEYDKDSKQIKTRYIGLYDLARSCQKRQQEGMFDEDDVTSSRIAVYLWNAALKNTSPTFWILTRVLQRARVDKYGVSAERAAIIKLVLNRNSKGGDFMVTENVVQGNRPVAYICGQIFAKMESVQYAALGERNAGIRERYFTYAMTAPASAFGRLFNLNSKHFTKLKNEKPGLAVTLDKELQELVKDVDINRFPATFSLEEQGQFAIGYYHQHQKQFSGGSKTRQDKEEK